MGGERACKERQWLRAYLERCYSRKRHSCSVGASATSEGYHDMRSAVVLDIDKPVGFIRFKLRYSHQLHLRGPKKSKMVSFSLSVDDLRFFNDQLQYIYEPGDFKVFVGGSSADVKEADFKLVK